MGGDRGTRQGGRGGIDDIHGRVVRRAIHHVACTPIQNTGAGHVRFLPRPDPDICYPPLKSNAHNYQTENNVFWKVVGRKTPPRPHRIVFRRSRPELLFSARCSVFFFFWVFSLGACMRRQRCGSLTYRSLAQPNSSQKRHFLFFKYAFEFVHLGHGFGSRLR